MSQRKQGVWGRGLEVKPHDWTDWKKNGSTKRSSGEFGIFKTTIPQTSVWGPTYRSIKVSDFFFPYRRRLLEVYPWSVFMGALSFKDKE